MDPGFHQNDMRDSEKRMQPFFLFVLAAVKGPYAKALLFPGKSALMLSTGVTL